MASRILLMAAADGYFHQTMNCKILYGKYLLPFRAILSLLLFSHFLCSLC